MSIKPSHILGMNGRHAYTKLNPTSAKQYGFSKLRTKALMMEHELPTAQLYHIFETLDDVDSINWENIPVPFVVKPASGSAGKGIVVLEKKGQGVWYDTHGESYTQHDLELHVTNILDGEYSTWGSNHKALIEEMIVPHPTLARVAYKGTPDIRIIIFNSVPVMAMMRVPTQESNGKANLDQGAIGLGIDMATGITTYGIKGKSGYIKYFPNSKKKVNGILIPFWKKALRVAAEAAQAAGYVYMGADLFIHQEKGPMIVELNGFPGLSIQLCNKAGLKRRIERVEGLDVQDARHGVKIAQALFAEYFADPIKMEEGLTIISTHPTITLHGDGDVDAPTNAMVNTSRFRSAISERLAENLGLLDIDDLLWRQQEKLEGKVPVVEIKFQLKNREITTAMVVTRRLDKTRHKVELGRKDLTGFLIGESEE